MSAGYSATPLLKKLGIRAGMKVAFVDAPGHYGDLLGELPEGLRVLRRPGRNMDFVHFFAPRAAALRRRFPGLKRSLACGGMLWVSWPKKSSALHEDLSGNDVRHIGLAGGLVDVKVCAVDEDWSGLKFVRRLEDRT